LIAATGVSDFYRCHLRREAPERHYLIVSKLLSMADGEERVTTKSAQSAKN